MKLDMIGSTSCLIPYNEEHQYRGRANF